VYDVSLGSGSYNFQKGVFTSAAMKVTKSGFVTDLRLRIQGFHHKWSDVVIAVKTAVVYLGYKVEVPMVADGCDQDADSGNFDIRFTLGGSDDRADICPTPPQANFSYADSLIDPIGGDVFENYVSGENKYGTWYVEWLDRGIGFPTNGKITSFSTVLCAIPSGAREHVVRGSDISELKVRRETRAVYGSL